MDRPTVTWQRRGDQVLLTGAIDDQAKLGAVLAEAQDGRLVLDLGAVTFINSLGLREWIRMQAGAVAGNIRVELRRVPEIIVHQLNIVLATRGNSIVTSFYAPYTCEDCDHDD